MKNMTKPPVARKLAVVCPTVSFPTTGGFKFELFQNACVVYKHAVVAAFRIYALRGEVAAKRRGWSLCIK